MNIPSNLEYDGKLPWAIEIPTAQEVLHILNHHTDVSAPASFELYNPQKESAQSITFIMKDNINERPAGFKQVFPQGVRNVITDTDDFIDIYKTSSQIHQGEQLSMLPELCVLGGLNTDYIDKILFPQKISETMKAKLHLLQIPYHEKESPIIKNGVSDLLKSQMLLKESFIKYLESSDYIPHILIHHVNVGSLDSSLIGEYFKYTGGWEGYRLGTHHEMGARQLEKLWPHLPKSFQDKLSLGFFRLQHVLHDIGKGRAVEKEGSAINQHNYTIEIINLLSPKLELLGVHPNYISLMKTIIGNDILGNFLQEREKLSSKLARYTQKFVSLSQQSKLTPLELYDAMYILYKCDTASYSLQSGAYEDKLYKNHEGKNFRAISRIFNDHYEEDGNLLFKGGKNGWREKSLNTLRESLKNK